MSSQTILEGFSDTEKGAYLGAIASLATADRQASPEELEHLEQLCQSANLSPEQTAAARQAATEISGEELNHCLDVLKNSELRYSLVTDLMAFARADNEYSEQEEQAIHKISNYLGVNQQQFSLLDQFSQKAVPTEEPATAGQQNFFGGGLQEKMQQAGINTGSLMKGVLAIAAPMILSRMLSGGRRGGMGGLGGGLGGMMGGGGLGSLIGMLSGGRGMGSTGGLLGRILGGRF